MEATEKNYRIADQILTVFAKENCTVLEATEILSYVSAKVREKSTVQYTQGELIAATDSVN